MKKLFVLLLGFICISNIQAQTKTDKASVTFWARDKNRG